MALTLERIRQVDIPINVSNKPNNLSDATRGIQLYNDSINLEEAIQLIVADSSPSNTNLSYTVVGDVFTLLSSNGTDTLLPVVTTTTAGLMSFSDKIKLNTVLTPTNLVIGNGLQGDGTSGSPLDWVGASVDGPITGSGTTFFPLDILDNSITSAHIANGTILFADWNQNSASSGQVPKWNGSAWVASTITGLLPTGSLGFTLFHNGTDWVALQRITETVTGIAAFFFNLATLPVSYAPIDVYRNGVLQVYSDDYTRSGQQISFTIPLTSLEKVTTIYYTS